MSTRGGESGRTDLVPDDKGTDKDERDGCEKEDGRDDAHGFEHLFGRLEEGGWEMRNYQFQLGCKLS